MNKHEINAYEQALAKYNPFHGVNFPITSVRLCEIINSLRAKYNEKVVELEHKNLMQKIEGFNELNFQPVESLYSDAKGEARKCYLLGKLECRVLASTESKTINVLIMTYLEQLEAIFEKAKEAKVNELDRKLSKNGITWREACRIAGIQHPGLTMQYMVKRGVFTKTWCYHRQDFYWKVTPKFIKSGLFKYVQTQGRNSEGFRVLTKGYDILREQADAINWKCLKFSGHPKHKAIYEKHFAEYAKAHPEEFDDFGVWLKPQW
ncbi:hypothetical protein HNP12_003775 [Aeromonas hydrophila]|uniref:hypothetical protein n=1 Tax=Aeromonas hydrophila TaxID=644 RepID=UPI0021674AC2|nr:hypothetical protein [Aeromonas hydrophila]MCS3769653.1 hypothetical protein [Aeromonas hydrophila]